MRTQILIFLTLFLLHCKPSLDQLPKLDNSVVPINGSISRIDGSTISSKELLQHIELIMDSANVHGLAISIFNDNTPIFKKGFGYTNADLKDTLKTDQIFYGASFSKAVFGYMVATLVKDGIIDLDTPLQNYWDVPIPDIPANREWRGFKNLEGDLRYKDITARMCLNHTTGFPNWRWLTKEFDFDRDGKLTFFFDPGSRYSYSGEGMQLLQYTIEHITGKGLEELAQEIVFTPLEMKMTSYLWQQRFEGTFVNGHTSENEIIPKDRNDDAGAAGSMETTLDDYSKFISHVLNEASSNSEISELMFTPSVRITSKNQFGYKAWEDTDENDDIELSYGMGWGILQTPYGYGAFKEGHDTGFQHYSIIFPQQKIGIVIMSNSDNAESTFKRLLELTIGDVYTPWKWERYIPYNY